MCPDAVNKYKKSSVFCVSAFEPFVLASLSRHFREFAKPIVKQDTSGIKPRTFANALT